MALNNKFYFLSPVEVVKVTPKNLEEVAEWCGGKIAKVESRRVKGRIDSYVWVPTPKGAPISWAFPGMYITKRLAITEQNEIKATFSVFRKDYFTRNYFPEMKDAVDQTWERQDKENQKAKKAARTIVVEVPEGHDIDAIQKELTQKLYDSVVPNDIITPELMPMVDRYLEEKEIDPVVDAEHLAHITRSDLPDSMVEQREVLHEDAVEAASEVQ